MSVTVIVPALLLFFAAALVWNLNTVIYKFKLALQGLLYLMFCFDKSWTKPQDPAKFFEGVDPSKVERKTIIFVRHGESTWNDTFNKGKHRSTANFIIWYIPNMLKSILYETYLLVSGQVDSWFYDAPLSYLGISQVQELGDFLARQQANNKSSALTMERALIKLVRGEEGAPSSLLVSSSLRRAISTMAIAFDERMKRRPEDKIHVIPSLQEISRNPDTLSITPPGKAVTASWIEKRSSGTICDFQSIFVNKMDMSQHIGNKPINTNGLKRMMDFNQFAFDQKEDAIVCGGHSIWFRSFFKTFLPYKIDHTAKKKKIVNAGVVAFMLLKVETPSDGVKYMIDKDSVQVIFGGF